MRKSINNNEWRKLVLYCCIHNTNNFLTDPATKVWRLKKSSIWQYLLVLGLVLREKRRKMNQQPCTRAALPVQRSDSNKIIQPRGGTRLRNQTIQKGKKRENRNPTKKHVKIIRHCPPMDSILEAQPSLSKESDTRKKTQKCKMLFLYSAMSWVDLSNSLWTLFEYWNRKLAYNCRALGKQKQHSGKEIAPLPFAQTYSIIQIIVMGVFKQEKNTFS